MTKLQRMIGALFFGAMVLPFLFAQGQDVPEHKKQADRILKPLKDNLGVRKPAKDVIDSLKTLEEVAEGLHQGMTRNIADMLNHRDPSVRRQAARTITQIGVRPDTAQMVVDTLCARLKDPDPEVRVAVLSALKHIGPYGKPAVPKAIEAYKNPDARVRRAAIQLVGYHLADNKDLMPVLISALDDPDLGPDEKAPGLASVTYFAISSLMDCKLFAKKAEPKLVKIVNSKKEDDADRWLALLALTQVAPENSLPLKIARGWLKNTDRPLDLTKAATLLRPMGARAEDAVPDLIAVAKLKPFADKSVELGLKMVLLEAFRAIGPAAKEALPALEEMTKTDDLTLRSQVHRTIKAVQGKD